MINHSCGTLLYARCSAEMMAGLYNHLGLQEPATTEGVGRGSRRPALRELVEHLARGVVSVHGVQSLDGRKLFSRRSFRADVVSDPLLSTQS